MGILNSDLPITLGALKTAFSKTGSWTLRNFLGGDTGGVTTNHAGYDGFIPASGTLKLTNFRDLTRANLRSTPLLASAEAWEYNNGSCSSTQDIYFRANGKIQFVGATTPLGQSVNQTIDNEWAFTNTSSILIQTAGNFEIRLTKTAGTAGAPSDNNTYVALSTDRYAGVSASAGSGSFDDRDLTCSISIRKSGGTELYSGSFYLYASAQSREGDPV